MVWFGGALQVSDTVISKYCTQTDLAATLLTQMGTDHSAYPWSRDIFNANASNGAFYVFNDGISHIDPQGLTVYDHQSKSMLLTGSPASEKEILCKAHLQHAYEDYLNK